MEKRYQVFVSSTYEDLLIERQEVMQALLELNCIPAGMELFPATDEAQWELIKRVIKECDYYILIVGGRYGSIAPQGKSYTEIEYEYALETGIPIVAFLHRNPGDIPARNTDKTEEARTELSRFRSAIETRRTCKYWTSPEELGSKVTRSIVSLIATKPGIGWVRADNVPDQTAAQEILKLRNRVAELEANSLLAPKGTEHLAQGDDSIALLFRYETESGCQESLYTYTWNELLRTLGPKLLTSASDEVLKSTLEEAFMQLFRPVGASKVSVLDTDFQPIKVQFRALGLIAKVTEGACPLWTLTPRGEAIMLQITAIHR